MDFKEITMTINELSEMLEINTSTLRNWEAEFELKIPRNNRNHRYYTDKEIDIFKIIKDGRSKNHSIDTMKMALNKHGIIEEQNEVATSMMTVDQLTVEDLKSIMANNFKEVIGEVAVGREEELKQDFERKLLEQEERLTENITNKLHKQKRVENQKLLLQISKMREEDKKKGFLSKLSGKLFRK